VRVIFKDKNNSKIAKNAGHILNKEDGWDIAVPNEETYKWERFSKEEYLLIEVHAEFGDQPLIVSLKEVNNVLSIHK